jgi:enamine deaminase RidA (YjgF/YER057c/UK114 family)
VRPAGTSPGGNFSPGILIEGTLYISGQAGEDKNFNDPRPTRTTVVVSRLVGEGHIEITATARQ